MIGILTMLISKYWLRFSKYRLNTSQECLYSTERFYCPYPLSNPEMGSADPVVKAWAVKARNCMPSIAAPGVYEVDGSYTRKDINRILKENVTMLWLDAREYDKFVCSAIFARRPMIQTRSRIS